MAVTQVKIFYNDSPEDNRNKIYNFYDEMQVRLGFLLNKYKIKNNDLIHIQIILKKFNKRILTDLQLKDSVNDMSGLPASFIESFAENSPSSKIEDLFGFFYCKVSCSDKNKSLGSIGFEPIS
jgi:hypothetical protein